MTEEKKKRKRKAVAENSEDVKEMIATLGEKSPLAESLVKKKRPWRQAVRHRARALRKKDGCLGDDTSNSKQDGSDTENAASINTSKNAAKNRKRKEKRKMLRNGSLSTAEENKKQETNTKEENDLETRLDASRFRFINEKLYTSTSAVAKKMFEEDREAYDAYHRGYRLQAKNWPLNPVDKIIRDLSTLPASTVIADVGCGDAKIAEKLGNRLKVHSFDLLASNEFVTAADMARLPLENDSVDIAVYCLSLMGTNISRFLREANRILKVSGRLKICEVSSRFRSVPKFTEAVEKLGFQLKSKKNLMDYFLTLSFTKTGKPETRRPMGLVLHPCLYKKR